MTPCGKAYAEGDSLKDFIEKISSSKLFKTEEILTAEKLREVAGNQAVVELPVCIILFAVQENATDVHIEPGLNTVNVRFRIDGVLRQRLRLDISLHATLIARLKKLANLDENPTESPQRGRIDFPLPDQRAELSFSTLPTIFGEKALLQPIALTRLKKVSGLKQILLSKHNYDRLAGALKAPYGILLIAGAPGSQKSGLLYSVLKHWQILRSMSRPSTTRSNTASTAPTRSGQAREKSSTRFPLSNGRFPKTRKCWPSMRSSGRKRRACCWRPPRQVIWSSPESGPTIRSRRWCACSSLGSSLTRPCRCFSGFSRRAGRAGFAPIAPKNTRHRRRKSTRISNGTGPRRSICTAQKAATSAARPAFRKRWRFTKRCLRRHLAQTRILGGRRFGTGRFGPASRIPVHALRWFQKALRGFTTIEEVCRTTA